MIQGAWTSQGWGIFVDSQERPPTFNQLQQLVREEAYYTWERNGRPHDRALDHWLDAERRLFGGYHEGGYHVYVCERQNPRGSRRFRYWHEHTVRRN